MRNCAKIDSFTIECRRLFYSTIIVATNLHLTSYYSRAQWWKICYSSWLDGWRAPLPNEQNSGKLEVSFLFAPFLLLFAPRSHRATSACIQHQHKHPGDHNIILWLWYTYTTTMTMTDTPPTLAQPKFRFIFFASTREGTNKFDI